MIFDVINARRLYAILKTEFEMYTEACERHTAEALSLVLMTNHLREWIAPGYSPDGQGRWKPDPPITAEQKFSREVYEDPNFAVIRALANGTKHAKEGRPTSVRYASDGLLRIGEVAGQEEMTGVPSEHLVDGQPLEIVLAPIMDLYRGWFEPSQTPN
jgi:hypothetical protein